MDLDTILSSIGSTEPSSFNEICSALRDSDSLPVGKSEWVEFFRLVEQAEDDGLLEVSRIKGRIDCAQLTTAGADRIRANLDSRRALARFQSFPDSYQLPEKSSLACRVIGNAVPPLQAQALCEPMSDGQ